ncbi:MAG: GNAT family N-acetyltransferase [Alphaproteobacteria bacterium]|nr:GNAT family N-acetyltransferase [Alphaproteobacteria bacterium]
MCAVKNDSGCLSVHPGWRGEALTTAELKLRPPKALDVQALTETANDAEIARWTADLPHPYQTKDAEIFLAKALQANASGREISLIIERIADGALVGAISLSIEDGQGRISYWIGRDFWKRGYATQSIRRMTRLAFQALGLSVVTAQVMTANTASCRLLEKLGFSGSDTPSCGLSGRCKDVPITQFQLDRKAWDEQRGDQPLLLVTAAALIDADGRVLLAKRPEGKAMAGLWEFPGGKMHALEKPEAAILRELKEELGIDATQSCLAPLAFASHDYDSFHLLMPLFVLRQWQGTPQAHEGQTLAWVGKDRLNDHPMPPADIPLTALLREWM